ncbi:MAG TPA: sulfotransferase [Solirubrobacteraceae bacterium]|nr:sulfotransferase [Solirubrobacteraceae bacterium]
MTSPVETLADRPTAASKLPDFFIVGHPKSGTTALYEMLRSHPDIYMPDLKETLFFARELHPGLRPQDPQPDTLEEYLSLFASARADQRAGEASPSYLRSREAAARIAAVQPHARIIAILREPASFLRSMHLELLKDHVETEKDLRKAIAREQVRREQKPVLWYSHERVEYAEQLRRYHEAFGPEQVLVLIYDDFRADNEATVRRVLNFLGVDETAPIAASEANPTVLVRSPRAYDMVRSLYLGRGPVASAVKATIKALTPQQARHDGMRKLRDQVLYGKPPAPDEALMLELRQSFKGEVQALSDYLGRDLVSLWGYDRIE